MHSECDDATSISGVAGQDQAFKRNLIPIMTFVLPRNSQTDGGVVLFTSSVSRSAYLQPFIVKLSLRAYTHLVIKSTLHISRYRDNRRHKF